MNLQDIAINRKTYELLKANGRVDALRFKQGIGPSLYEAWNDCAIACGYNPIQRTPASEAYEDGWYSL